MQFKLSLVALSSLAVVVAAGHLKARQADSDCTTPGSTVFCCPQLENASSAAGVAALAAANTTATGTVGIGCTASFGGEDEDTSCDDEVDVACCQAVPGNSLVINCIEFEA